MSRIIKARALASRLRRGVLRGRRLPIVIAAAGGAAGAGGVALHADGVWSVVAVAVAITSLPAVLLLLWSVELTTVSRRFAELTTDLAKLSSDVAGMVPKVDTLGTVLADESRRPWEPTLLPWQLTTLPDKPVVLLPAGDYHLPEIVELATELRRLDVQTVVACGRPHWARTAEGLSSYPDVEVLEAPTPEQLLEVAGGLVTMADWGGYRPLVVAANVAGIPTFAKVEGACDYDDADTAAVGMRFSYQTARTILCQGSNDATRLPGQDTPVVGSTRLERLWWAPPARPHKPLAVINLNFSYGVLRDARRMWLDSAVEGCERAGIPFVISLHPAEPERSLHPASVPIGVSRLLPRATVLISRFSTAPFEAMARGVPFVYHNPHGEQVDTFHEPNGAYDVSRSADQLSVALGGQLPVGGEARRRSETFFRTQVDIDDTRTAAARTAAAVIARL